MNDLYLIGNGFDLAHGLKTSYNDFLLWYLNESLKNLWEFNYFEDDLMKIDRKGSSHQIPSNFKSISELIRWSDEHHYSITPNHDFFKKIVKNYRDYKWVDIEYEYYMSLVEIFRGMEKANVLRSDFHFSQVKPLNDCFEAIKKKLVEYLISVKISYDLKNKQIEEILFEETGIYQMEKTIERMVGQQKEEKLFVCFNYTQTMEVYLRNSTFENSIIYIHGELKDVYNPTIFGYGDEIDSHYEKIENLNNNDFLKNIKSFSYFKTDNYQRVMRFIESNGFTVKILGHSCGLSDRILLNTIFENENCKAIKIFHYEKSPSENDYFEKTQDISRHFKASKKDEMRLKIVPFNRYSKMPQNPK